MIAGIPQRLAVLKEGYATLMDQTSVPSTVAHAGFGTTRAWADANMETAIKIEGVILKTLDFVEKHPDEAFPIISEKLREQGTNVDAQALKGVWNNMEFFPNGKAWYEEKVVAAGGQFYWKDRFETIINNLKAEKKITELKVPLEDLNHGLKTVGVLKNSSVGFSLPIQDGRRRRPPLCTRPRNGMPAIRLIDVDLPEFGVPQVQPVISFAIYAERLVRLRERAVASGP